MYANDAVRGIGASVSKPTDAPGWVEVECYEDLLWGYP